MFGYAYICECICAIEIIFCCKLQYLLCSHYSTLRPSRYFEIQCFTTGCTVRCISVKIEPVFGNVTASSAIRCIFQKVLERNNHALNSVFISVKPLSFAVHRAAFHCSRVNFISVGKRSYRRCIVFCRIDTDAYQFF